jgi:hypothetical protein
MSEPVVYSGDLLHLDGVIAFAAYRDLDDRTRRRIPPISSPWAVDLRLPLSRWFCPAPEEGSCDPRLLKEGRIWGWAASAEASAWAGRGVAEVRKRPPLDQMRRYASDRRVETGAGPLKAYDLVVPTVFAREVLWYAHGVRSEVERLLVRHAPAIGKKRGIGYGTVLRWRVEACGEDLSVVRADGTPARRMPASSGLVARAVRATIRPPYHHGSRVCDAVEPAAC